MNPPGLAEVGTAFPGWRGWRTPQGGFAARKGGTAPLGAQTRLTYKYAGTVNGEFWWSVSLCPFPPGELDPYYPQLRRLPAGTPLAEFALGPRTTGG